MNLTFARQILQAAEMNPDGRLELHGRKMRHEAELMEEAGWLELTKPKGARSALVARLTETGRRVSGLFRDDAVAQRLRDAFMPRTIR
ncbi:MAG TPA: hypothetical protein VGL24_00435 [Chthoniobacterales bacterium]|jgi:hypothetical protein